MHELGLAHDLFDVVLSEAKKNGVKNITKISIKVGEASGIEHDFLIHSLKDHILPGTIAKEAQIEISVDPIKLECKQCRTAISSRKDDCCSKCGSKNFEIISGKDIYVESIESD